MWVRSLAGADASCGGKAHGLARAIAAGLPVPDGFVVEPAALAGVIGDAAELAEIGHHLAAALLRIRDGELPRELVDVVEARAAALGTLAVRSSATVEDTTGGAAPGVFASIIDVPARDVWPAIRSVWASALTPLAVAYGRRRERSLALAVIVQRHVPGERITVYTRPPGAPTGELVWIQRGAGLERLPRSRAPEDADLAAIVELAMRAEVAIEAAGGADVELVGRWLVQARPIVHPVAQPRLPPPPAVLAGLVADGRAWTWDVAHNPDPLSVAQADLVERVERAAIAPWSMRVCAGYLYSAPRDLAPPREVTTRSELVERAAASEAAIARALADDVRPSDTRDALEDAIARYLAFYEIWAAELVPLIRSARRGLAIASGAPGPAATRSVDESIASSNAATRSVDESIASPNAATRSVAESILASPAATRSVAESILASPSTTTQSVAESITSPGAATRSVAESILASPGTTTQSVAESIASPNAATRSVAESIASPVATRSVDESITSPGAATRSVAESIAQLRGARPSAVEMTLLAAARGELDEAVVVERIGVMAPAWDVAAPTFAEMPGSIRDAIARLRADLGRVHASVDRPPHFAGRTSPLARIIVDRPPRFAGRTSPLARIDQPLSESDELAREAADLAERDDVWFARAQWLVRRAILARARALGIPDDIAFWIPLADLTGGEPSDLESLRRRAGAARAAAVRAAAWDMPLAVNRAEATGPSLVGVGSGGRASGRVVRIVTLASPISVGRGDVVVTRAITPALAVIVIGCAAIVSESGGPLDHGAAMARELGIPSIVGCRDAWSQLSDGMLVTVDADAGTVTR